MQPVTGSEPRTSILLLLFLPLKDTLCFSICVLAFLGSHTEPSHLILIHHQSSKFQFKYSSAASQFSGCILRRAHSKADCFTKAVPMRSLLQMRPPMHPSFPVKWWMQQMDHLRPCLPQNSFIVRQWRQDFLIYLFFRERNWWITLMSIGFQQISNDTNVK